MILKLGKFPEYWMCYVKFHWLVFFHIFISIFLFWLFQCFALIYQFENTIQSYIDLFGNYEVIYENNRIFL